MALLAKYVKKGLLPLILVISMLLPSGALALPSEGGGLPLEGFVIGIDPGHQLNPDNGYEAVSPEDGSKLKTRMSEGCKGVATGTPEYEINLLVSLKLAALLRDAGAEVVLTRTRHDVSISNMERAEMMNDAGVDLWIRIHCNSSRSSRTSGALMLAPGKKSELHSQSSALAKSVLNAFCEATEAKKRSISYTSTQTGFNFSHSPVVTVEMGYLSNPQEELLLCRDSYQDLCADGICCGILNYCAGIAK